MPKVLRKPAGNVRKKAPRGKADTLAGSAMKSWLQHLKGVGPTWCYVLLSMCHLLCCRVTEVLRLQFKHIDLDSGRVQVGELKKQEKILKPLTDTAKTFFTQLRDNAGHSEQRTRRCGSRGYVTYQDSWGWSADPEAFLFPATRKDATAKHMNKAHRQFYIL